MLKNYLFVVLAILFTVNAMAQNIPSYVPKDGLVGYWPFNGNANDESGNGNHGTVNGATLTADRNGVANSAYSFDGDNDWINAEMKQSIKTKFSFSFWLNINEWKESGIINSRTSYYNATHFDLFSNYIMICLGKENSDKSLTCENINKKIEINNWNNIILSFDGSNMKVYKNNQLFFSITLISNEAFIDKLLDFGRDNWTGGKRYFNGQLDDISIYNRALSEQEVKQLYEGCTKETVTSSNFNTLMYTTNAPLNLTATPTGGSFSGNGVANNAFNPSKAKLGKNQVKYNFKNTTGCIDSTDFTMLVVDTVGASCIKYDTVKVNKYDTLKITKFDTVTVKNNIYDTVTIKNNVFDTVIVKTNVFDTVKVNKYDTITIINNVTKYDTITVENNIYDTVTVTNNVTKYDTVIVKTNVFDTVKVTKYDTLTITNNVTKYDTVIVNKTNYDTVSILKIKFKLTTGIHANQLSSLSIYPNPTSDVLHIEVPDAKALEGYRYRIVDALGKEVYNQLVTQSTTEIPLKTLGAAGIYQFEILDAKNASIQSNKIVLQ